MEPLLYNSSICRLCAEENENGIFLYSSEEIEQNLSKLINTYLPIKLSDDGILPRTICHGCNIQLEATMEFINLIVNGQKIIRELLYQREIDVDKSQNVDRKDVITENILYDMEGNVIYQVDHPIALKVAGVEKPKRKRGRPPKKPKSVEEMAQEADAKAQAEANATLHERQNELESCGKRKRKAPTRFQEAVQGKELERIFIQEGVIDGEESDQELKAEPEVDPKPPNSARLLEVIGHSETSGELVVVVKGKGRGRPKGRMLSKKQQCAICQMEFSCVGRYMSHVAQHGPVTYECSAAGCGERFPTRLRFNEHQRERDHRGQSIIHTHNGDPKFQNKIVKTEQLGNSIQSSQSSTETEASKPTDIEDPSKNVHSELYNQLKLESPNGSQKSSDVEVVNLIGKEDNDDKGMVTMEVARIDEITSEVASEEVVEQNDNTDQPGKKRLKCNLCDKTFSNRQSKSMHVKALHAGERPYVCGECGATFPYPRSLSLHALTHRRTNPSKGFACDLCGKVLNHPSSVVYHKEAEHAGQSYACSKCGKSFKHKQLLQRHQLVHSQLRPYNCKTCGASFKTKANLLNHQMLHSGIKKYSCELCKQRFAHKTSLTLHMRWHTGQKPYACGVCGKSFTQKGNLSEHARIHTGEKPYRCGECPRAFTTSSQYRLHLRRHTGERPYSCINCGKKFASRESWRAHVRREAGTRQHRCECGRAFSERWALLKHRRSHTGERPFRCPHCPRAFADSSNLNKHKKQVHKQMSLLASSHTAAIEEEVVGVGEAEGVGEMVGIEEGGETAATTEAEPEERVVFLAYNVHDGQSYHLLDPQQVQSMDEGKMMTTLYSVSAPKRPPQPERVYYQPAAPATAATDLVLDDTHIALMDEQGNPLTFTTHDGTRIAITSADGETLQVVTQDGQAIPLEFDDLDNEQELEQSGQVVHQLRLKTSDVEEVPSAHYYTIV